jgi:2-methylcitrate dehydratase PrpD
VIGRSERIDALSAVFLNAAGANVHDFCDTYVRTVIHPTAPVAPPLLALSELRRVSGPDLILSETTQRFHRRFLKVTQVGNHHDHSFVQYQLTQSLI